MNSNDTATFDDDVAAVLREGALVICFQRACDALRDRRLDHKERSVLAVLLESMNSETGTAWPSRETIAERLFMSVKTVMNALYELKRMGYVDWERRPLLGGRPLIQYTVPLARFDREALQLAIADAIMSMRAAPPAGHKKLPRPQGTSGKTTPNTGQKSALTTGYAPPAGQQTAPDTGHGTAPPAGQQELTKELTKEKKEYGPNLRSDLPLLLPSDQMADKPKRKNGAPSYTETFEVFWKAYPDRRNNSKPNAFEQWRKLSPEDRDNANRSLSQFAAYLRSKPDTPCVHAERYLKWRRFDGYLDEPEVAAEPWWKDSAKVAAITDAQWRGSIAKYANGIWPPDRLGPAPGNPRCVVPKHLITELRLTERYTEKGISREKH